MDLIDSNGCRLYLNQDERERFKEAATKAPRTVRTFCNTLFYTGCRISEALELTPGKIDLSDEQIIFRSLKKRGDKPKYRAVPVPPALLDELNLVHGLQEGGTPRDARLWSWCRTTAWRRVIEVMAAAGIEGAYATPKGLRHSYGVNAVLKNIPPNKLQQWLGHEDMATTAIYANVLGDEAKALAAKMWE